MLAPLTAPWWSTDPVRDVRARSRADRQCGRGRPGGGPLRGRHGADVVEPGPRRGGLSDRGPAPAAGRICRRSPSAPCWCWPWGGRGAALGRVVETLVGAVVGVLVNLLIAPPLYVQPASEAIVDLAHRMARGQRLADALRGKWSRSTADVHLAAARALGAGVARADARLAQTEESARLNPRGTGRARGAAPRLRGRR